MELTAWQSMRADMFPTAAVPGRSAVLDVCVASSVAAAARGDLHRRHSIAKFHTTGKKLVKCGIRAFITALLFGRRTDERTAEDGMDAKPFAVLVVDRLAEALSLSPLARICRTCVSSGGVCSNETRWLFCAVTHKCGYIIFACGAPSSF